MKMGSLLLLLLLTTVTISNGLAYRKLNRFPKTSNFSNNSPCNNILKFAQRVDHFNLQYDDLYLQRYIIDRSSWLKNGPIFFYTGNEGDIQWFCENTGFVWEIAPKFNAMVVFAEHRYYGDSMPYGNKSMQRPYINFLTSEQALADYAYLIKYLKDNTIGASNSPVIAFGGSYGGMLSSWFRMKYPNIIAGSIAASAPIWQTISDCGVFAQINTDTFKRANTLCPDIIRASWSIINDMGKTEEGLKEIQSILKLCKPINSTDQLKDWLVDIYGNAAMSDYPYETTFLSPLPASPVSIMCDKITSIKSLSDPIDILIGIYEGINVYNNYTGNVACFDTGSDTPSDINMDAWVYQTCTEFVFPTCSNGKTDMFEEVEWNYDEYVKTCFSAFQVIPRPEWSTIYYGGKNIKAHSNIVFSNGNLDPWSGGGVLVNLTDKLPSLLIQGGAHHLDLRSSNPKDPSSVINVRNSEIDLIKKWISN